MSIRTVVSIEADIDKVKKNPNWFKNAGDKVLLAALTTEKNLLFQQAAQPAGDYFIILFIKMIIIPIL